ncbi:hypothetical protein [Paenibacillus agricola]|uniref:Uncharacterized protein n=1 Tax=Paenibacillus agricola TaxID=2716264 RepID=A0ABX0J487_9BACL|nr:hypothetical protein [Paenibacillus agricola]NHN31145.1 hypothetical protein [Paenibacillus agricola]
MNFRQRFSAKVDSFISNLIEDRDERILAVQELIEEYTVTNGQAPVYAELERLADAILNEELTDTAKNKISITEYPFLSERQFERRYEREYSLSLADTYDSEGTNRAKPEKRRRTAKENRFVDKLAIVKNRRRNARYRRDTSVGALISYNLHVTGGELPEPFTECAGISERARMMADSTEYCAI